MARAAAAGVLAESSSKTPKLVVPRARMLATSVGSRRLISGGGARELTGARRAVGGENELGTSPTNKVDDDPCEITGGGGARTDDDMIEDDADDAPANGMPDGTTGASFAGGRLLLAVAVRAGGGARRNVGDRERGSSARGGGGGGGGSSSSAVFAEVSSSKAIGSAAPAPRPARNTVIW